MRLIGPAILLALSCFGGDDFAPQITNVSPKIVKPGDTVTIVGLALSDATVEEVYLSDHKFDMKVKVLDQTTNQIKFRVPPFAKPGRMQLLMLAKPEKEGGDPKLLELPAYLMIEDTSQEITQVQPPAKGKKSKDQNKQKDQQNQ
ncbi:MAG: IPT/TIG domain-containing protein [Bryobacteraceae bacterium]|jgi:hypothetical protein